MSRTIEELGWADTPMGEITLRRRMDPVLRVDVYEVKLGDEYLMSSLFTVAEIALARLGLQGLLPSTDRGLDVVVGGLGLGYTAAAVLELDNIDSLVVVEALDAVIDWHQGSLIPETAGLAHDARTRLIGADFFAQARSVEGFDPEQHGRQFAAILLDIDHSPRHVLHPTHADFYTADGLSLVRRHLHSGGRFALWSDDPPDQDFLDVFAQAFADTTAHVVEFDNALTGGVSANTVYVGTAAAADVSA